MDNLNSFILARILHVIGVVFWIGGVAFVTTVFIPSLKRITGSTDKLELFEQMEGRFSFQAKFAVLVTGISGFYMLDAMNAWGRYLYLQFWWLHLMTLVWLLFVLVLFVLEPLFLHRWFHQLATRDCNQAFGLLHRMHMILLAFSLLAIFGAIAGVHGF